MRIVAIADTHTFEDDLEALPAGDVLVHAGDLCRAGTLDELASVAEWLAVQPHPHKIVVAGNHDWCFVRQRERASEILGAATVYLQDSGVTIAGVRFWGSPWQPAFNDWAFNLPRGAPLREKWQLIPNDTDVLVTHSPPEGYGDRLLVRGRSGCSDLLDAVRRVRPRLHLFGHIHHDGGVWQDEASGATLCNVTTWECERGPTVVDVDVESGLVSVVEAPPRAES